MPTAAEILALLEKTSNELFPVAIGFHVLIVALLVVLIRKWQPTDRVVGILLTSPLLLVSVIAWIYRNPFTGILFLLFFCLLFITAIRLSGSRVDFAQGTWLFFSIFLIAFGWFYPHFLDDRPWLYLFAAPTGIIPCPTLSLVIGFTLLFKHFNSKPYALLLSIISLFYGLFGAFRLGVMIDVVLIAGAILLLISAFPIQKKPSLV